MNFLIKNKENSNDWHIAIIIGQTRLIQITVNPKT